MHPCGNHCLMEGLRGRCPALHGAHIKRCCTVLALPQAGGHKLHVRGCNILAKLLQQGHEFPSAVINHKLNQEVLEAVGYCKLHEYRSRQRNETFSRPLLTK